MNLGLKLSVDGEGAGISAPSSLSISGTGPPNQMVLTWDGNAVQVWRGTASGGETLLATISAATTYTDSSSVLANTPYFYYVKNVSGGQSNEATATLLPVAPSIVQSTGSVSVASGFGLTVTGFQQNITPGNAIVVIAAAEGSTGSMLITAVNDGNAYTSASNLAVGPGLDSGEDGSLGIWYLESAVGGNKPAPFVTLNGHNATNGIIGVALEVAGLVTAAPEATNSNSGNGVASTPTTVTTGAITTTNPNDLLIVGMYNDVADAITASPAGFTSQARNASNNNLPGFDASTQVVSTTQTGLNPSYTLASAAGRTNWAALIIALKAKVSTSGRTAATFYVSPSGSDAHTGLTPTLAWQTLSHASAQTFQGGDILALQGGQSFSDSITLTAANFGANLPTSSSSFTITTYGAGNATIQPGNGSGISVTNVPYVGVSNQIVSGPGVTVTLGSPNTSSCTSTAPGIVFTNTGSSKLGGPTISNCSVGGCQIGIEITTGSALTGFNGTTLSSVSTTLNFEYGIYHGTQSYSNVKAHSNLTMTGCVSNSNSGVSGVNANTGYGFWLGSTDTFTLTGCSADGNGLASSVISSTGGPCGLGLFQNMTNGTVSASQFTNQHDQSGVDGEGINVGDGGVNITIHGCLTIGNFGGGHTVSAATAGFAQCNNVTFQNSISQGDSTGNVTSPLNVSGQNVGTISFVNMDVYNTSTVAAANNQGGGGKMTVTNCILQSHNSGKMIALAAPGNGDQFIGNIYDPGSGTFNVVVTGGGTYASLAAMQAAHVQGLEYLATTTYGQQGAPSLTNAGGGAAQLPAHSVTTLTAYDPTGGISEQTGVNANSLLGVAVATTDFHGNANTSGGKWDVGAVKS